MEVFLICLGLAIFIWAVIRSVQRSDKLRLANTALSRLDGMVAHRKVIRLNAAGALEGLAIDTESRRLCLLTDERRRILPFEDLIAVDLLVDSDMVTVASRTSQAVGALVGGALLGGMGAVIGGLTGTSTSRKKISKLALRLRLNNLQQPSHTIHFLQTAVPAAIAEPLLREATEWADLLHVVVHQSGQAAAGEKTAGSMPG